MKGSETITVKPHASGERDWRGDPIEGSNVLEPFDVEECAIWPRFSTEDSSRGEVIIEGLNVFVPPPAVVGPLDVVTARGKDWAVDGAPGEFVKNGEPKGSIVVLKKAGT